MNRLTAALASALALLAVSLAPAAHAQAQAPADALTDPAMKGPAVIAFIGVKPGDRVADIVAGRFVRALSQAVGPKGKVYAYEPAEVVKAHPQVMTMLSGLKSDPAYANVEVSSAAINTPALPSGLDA